MRALVTGATGFLGRNLCEDLIANGWDVIGLGRNQIRGEWLRENQVDFIKIDLIDLDQLKLNDLSIDVVFHCAAFSSIWGAYNEFYQANVAATKKLAEACVAAKIMRFIHVSTSSVYFDFKDKLNIREEDALPVKFVNHYASTKFLAEQLLMNDFSKLLNISIIRPRGIFGEFDQAIMPRLLKLSEHGKIPLPRKGSALIDVTYVKNVTSAMIGLAVAGSQTFGEIYNISNQQPLPIKQLLNQMCIALDRPLNYKHIPYYLADKYALMLETYHTYVVKTEPLVTRYSLGLLAFNQVLNIDKAEKHFAYQPIYSIEQGITRYAKSIK